MVATDTRGSGFESSHEQLLLNNYLLFVGETKIKKETGNGPFLNKVQSTQNHTLETKNEKPQFFVTDTR